MESERLLQLLQQCEQRGGLVSHRRLADGLEVPYEINISWVGVPWRLLGGIHHTINERVFC